MALGPGGHRRQGSPGCSCRRGIGLLTVTAASFCPSAAFTSVHSVTQSLAHSFNCRCRSNSSGRVRSPPPFKVPPFKTTTLPPFGQTYGSCNLSRAEVLLEERPGRTISPHSPSSFINLLFGRMGWIVFFLLFSLSLSIYMYTFM